MDTAVDLVRQAVDLGLVLAAPALAASIAIGLLTGIVQTVTQIQEQTLSFVPRLVVVTLTVFALLPWSIERLVDYAQALYREMPTTF